MTHEHLAAPATTPVQFLTARPRRTTDEERASLHGKSLAFVLKVASRCNLDCTYCYVYNKGDDTWRERPVFMSDAVVDAAIGRIERWCRLVGQRTVRVTFHGGEPLLAGRARFDRWCRTIRQRLADVADVEFNIQTNATLIDDAWAELFQDHRIEVGVSIDGPQAVHDANRVDRHGAGSHSRVVRGIERLVAHDVWTGALAVIQLGADSVAVHRHITSLGFTNVNYLLPDYTHETVGEVRRRHGPTPCADYLLPVFDDWWFHDSMATRIPLFIAVTRLLLGGRSNIDMVGNEPFGFVFIESDGSIEDLDALRTCRHGMAGTGLSVFRDDVADVGLLSPLHRAAMFDGLPVPTGCAGCPESTTCRGGYLPHRYSTLTGFDNRSVWCADLLALFGHARTRLGVDLEETEQRRQALAEMVPIPGEAAMSLDGIDEQLRWLVGTGMIDRLDDRHLERAEAALRERGGAECIDAFERLGPEGRRRILRAPEVTRRLLFGDVERAGAVEFVKTAIATERAVVGGQAAAVAAPSWSALGDVMVDSDGTRQWWPQLDDRSIPLDFGSPWARRIDLSGRRELSTASRTDFTASEVEEVRRRIVDVTAALERLSTTVTGFVRRATCVLVLQIDAESPHHVASGTNGNYIGRTFVTNPQSDGASPECLAEGLVHEAIHGLLYRESLDAPFVTGDAAVEEPRVESPWTGRALPVRAYLEAAFVWIGLVHLWALAARRPGPFDPAVARERLIRSCRGFGRGRLADRVAAWRPEIRPDVVEVIDDLQTHVVAAMDGGA